MIISTPRMFLLAFTIAAPGLAAAAEPYTPPRMGGVLRTLKPEHPRLLLTADRMRDIKQLVEHDKVAGRIYQTILEDAERALKQKPCIYELRDGRRLLYVSRDVLGRVESLSFAFLMTGKRDYVQRAWAELDSAAKFQDWHPAHFLDTAEMTHAFAIGYDWLWDQWTPRQRETLRRAIVELGLKPAIKVYGSDRGWHMNTNNWNQVCNGGIGLGALAIADEEPELAAEVLAHGLSSIPRAMEYYAPDGGGGEGASYWAFGSRYNVLLLAALESALGTDFDLSRVDGFRQSGDYQIYLSGANRTSFDFCDCSLSPLSTPQHFWMAQKYDTPRYAWFRDSALCDGERGSLLDLLWFDAAARDYDFQGMALDRHFRGVEVASMRDSWIDGEGFIAALQGGANRGSHRHLDLGSFILEADGIRWIIDSGKESETYQKHANHVDRWDYYRTRAEGHNTLVINPGREMDQGIRGTAPFTTFDSRPDQATATIDLTTVYDKDARNVTRTFTLLRGREFTVIDNISCPKPAVIWSFFHTKADVDLSPDQRVATLTKDGKSLKVKLESPSNAVFEVLPAEPGPKSPKPAKQASNKGRRKLAIHLSEVESATIQVVFHR